MRARTSVHTEFAMLNPTTTRFRAENRDPPPGDQGESHRSSRSFTISYKTRKAKDRGFPQLFPQLWKSDRPSNWRHGKLANLPQRSDSEQLPGFRRAMPWWLMPLASG